MPCDASSKETGRDIAGELEWLRNHKDRRLYNYLNKSWILASEAYAWSVPNWGVFCDLCSENWVFLEEESKKKAIGLKNED